MDPIKHILLASDGSEHALRAAAYAGMLARCTGAELTVAVVHSDDLAMLNAVGPAMWPATVPYAGIDPAEVRSAVEKQAKETTLVKTVEACGAVAALNEPLQLWGQVAEEICQYADQHGVDVIVLGTRGHSSFSKLLLGSVSTQVANHAHCAVTLVR